MEEALKEIARYTSALKRLARAEQTAAANLASRYTARRAEALAALSPAARRLHDAMSEVASLPDSPEALVEEPKHKPPGATIIDVGAACAREDERLQKLMTESPPEPPTAPIVIERTEDARRAPRR